jgi:hypothetical protein
MDVEKLATQKELRRKLELENAITTGSVLDRAALSKGFAQLADALSGAVMNSDLPRLAKENFLTNLSGWPLILDEVTSRQTKLVRGGNGQTDESED